MNFEEFLITHFPIEHLQWLLLTGQCHGDVLIVNFDYIRNFLEIHLSEAFPRKGSYKKVLWKYAANLQENAHAEV